jgi:hypothetical protein
MAAILKNYTFNKTARTITFSDFPSILLQDIGEIVNVTRNIVIYDPLDVAKGSTSLVNNVLTLFFDTSLQADTDVLRIVYGDSYAQKITVGSGGGGGSAGGLTNSELRASPVGITIGALSTGASVYRTSITAPDIATPVVGTLTTAAGGSLLAVPHQVRVACVVNDFGSSLAVIPANNGITATASGVIRIPITPNGLDFDIFLGSVADPLYLGRVTAAEVASGVIITGAATATANCAKTTSGATAGVVECRVLGTQRAASTNTVPFSFVMPAGAPINCAGKQFVDIDVEVTLTASPVLPVIVIVPFFFNPTTNTYFQSDTVSPLNFSAITSNRTRLRYQVQGNTGVHLAIQSIVGVGASINMWSSVS